MGAPLPAFAFLPPVWAEQAVLRDLPTEPGLSTEHACWIASLNAWVGESKRDAEWLRLVVSKDERVLTVDDLPRIPDPHFGSDDQMLAWCRDEGLEPNKDEEGHWDWLTVWAQYLARMDDQKV